MDEMNCLEPGWQQLGNVKHLAACVECVALTAGDLNINTIYISPVFSALSEAYQFPAD